MSRLRCLVFVTALCGASASAYDSRVGDRLLGLEVGASDARVSFSQFFTPRVISGVYYEQGRVRDSGSVKGSASVKGAGFRVGWDHHQSGSALIPCASLDFGLAWLSDDSVHLRAASRAGVLWYPIRRLGLGLDLGFRADPEGTTPLLNLSGVLRF